MILPVLKCATSASLPFSMISPTFTIILKYSAASISIHPLIAQSKSDTFFTSSQSIARASLLAALLRLRFHSFWILVHSIRQLVALIVDFSSK